MNADHVRELGRATLSGSLPFPEIVRKLIDEGVDYYHVDYAALQMSFYSALGGVALFPLSLENLPAIAAVFDPPALMAAIRDSQNNGQKFRDFASRAVQAGVAGYFAFLSGQRVTYFGRHGDHLVEWFPGAARAEADSLPQSERQVQKLINSPERIWVGPRYHDQRIFILGESWFGDFEGDLATDDGYITAYLSGKQSDRLYTTLSEACGPDRHTFWEQVMFTNYIQRIGPTRAHRPIKSQYLEARDRLRNILVRMQPHGVWVIGKEQGKYSAPVVREFGIPVVIVNHPSSHRGEKQILHEGLRASWQELCSNAAKYCPDE
jgi:uncharacterized protein YbcV (DUF1398 family)